MKTAIIGTLVTIGVVLAVVWGIVALVQHNNRWNAERGRGDAQVGHVDSKPRDVYEMPDRFSNVAEFCDKYGNAIIMTTTDNGKAIWGIPGGCE